MVEEVRLDENGSCVAPEVQQNQWNLRAVRGFAKTPYIRTKAVCAFPIQFPVIYYPWLHH